VVVHILTDSCFCEYLKTGTNHTAYVLSSAANSIHCSK